MVERLTDRHSALSSPQHPLPVAAPIAMTAQGSHEHLVIRKAPQPSLPTGNLISMLHPNLYHLLVKNLSIPMLLPSNALTPLQQRIELEGTKTTQIEIRVLLQLEQTQRVCKTKKMEEHQEPRLHALYAQNSDHKRERSSTRTD